MEVKSMTVKKIAEFLGKGDTTIRKWIEVASAKMAGLSTKMAQAKEQKKPAEFSFEETIFIMETGGVSKDLIDMMKSNLIPNESEFVTKEDLKGFTSSIVNDIVKPIIEQNNNFMKGFMQEVRGMLLGVGSSKEMIALPEIKKEPLSEVNQIIRAYAVKNDRAFQAVWTQFYIEFKYHTGKDVMTIAKHRGIKAIDIIREMAMEEKALQIARKIFGEYV